MSFQDQKRSRINAQKVSEMNATPLDYNQKMSRLTLTNKFHPVFFVPGAGKEYMDSKREVLRESQSKVINRAQLFSPHRWLLGLAIIICIFLLV